MSENSPHVLNLASLVGMHLDLRSTNCPPCFSNQVSCNCVTVPTGWIYIFKWVGVCHLFPYLTLLFGGEDTHARSQRGPGQRDGQVVFSGQFWSGTEVLAVEADQVDVYHIQRNFTVFHLIDMSATAG